MDLCKNRNQQRLCAKVTIIAVVLVGIVWIVIALHQPKEEVKTCEPTISVRKMGQFGNQIWEYMSLYVFWKTHDVLNKYDFTPYIDEDMKENLEQLFENLTIQSFPKVYLQCDDRETLIVPKEEEQFRLPEEMDKRNILLGSYSARYKDVIAFRMDNIKNELRFRQKYVDVVTRTLDEIKANHSMHNNETIFVGMHYRGGDYIPHLEGNHGNDFKGPPNYSYYTSAMNHFKRKYENVIFILVSIDEKWLAVNAPRIKDNGTVVSYGKDRNTDLTLLAHCNHSIINYGTFGVTAALFAGGETVVYDLGLPVDNRGDTLALGLAKLCPKWTAMKNTVKDG